MRPRWASGVSAFTAASFRTNITAPAQPYTKRTANQYQGSTRTANSSRQAAQTSRPRRKQPTVPNAGGEALDERADQEDAEAPGGGVEADRERVGADPLQVERQQRQGERDRHPDRGRGQDHEPQLAPRRGQQAAA